MSSISVRQIYDACSYELQSTTPRWVRICIRSTLYIRFERLDTIGQITMLVNLSVDLSMHLHASRTTIPNAERQRLGIARIARSAMFQWNALGNWTAANMNTNWEYMYCIRQSNTRSDIRASGSIWKWVLPQQSTRNSFASIKYVPIKYWLHTHITYFVCNQHTYSWYYASFAKHSVHTSRKQTDAHTTFIRFLSHILIRQMRLRSESVRFSVTPHSRVG